jgi:hypothetical protein
MNVPSRVFHLSAAGLIPPANNSANNSDVDVMPVRETSACESADFDAELRDLFDSYANGLGCIRGVQAALAIEVAGALLIFAIWLLAHFLW